jgi:hypothetical protein
LGIGRRSLHSRGLFRRHGVFQGDCTQANGPLLEIIEKRPMTATPVVGLLKVSNVYAISIWPDRVPGLWR